MAYVILIEKSKPTASSPRQVAAYYSRSFGMYCSIREATVYSDFDRAQKTVRALRAEYPHLFITAVSA
jgi:hypothetical protein